MSAPILVLALEAPVTVATNVTDACGGSAPMLGVRGYDGSEWIMNSNGGYVRKLWSQEDGLPGIIPFADSGTLPYIGGWGLRPSLARFWTDDVDGYDPDAGAPAVGLPGYAGNLNWQTHRIPQANSGLKWVLPADQRKRFLFASMSKWQGEFTIKAHLTGTRASTACPDQTITTAPPASEAMFAWSCQWRGIDAGETLELEVRKTTSGVGELGIEFMYITIPEPPARPKGFRNSLNSRAAWGGRNE